MTSAKPRWLWRHDVFLNFRGDIREPFVNDLFKYLCENSVRTFRDDGGIKKGENISVELLKAIEDSRISIVIFSKTYVESRWCLDELLKILECKHKLGQIIFPIFYDVDLSMVRNQTKEFGNALTQHRERFGIEKVDKWKAALFEIANLSGWDLQTTVGNRCDDLTFIKKITEEVLSEVNSISSHVARYPVGIESRVKDILHILQSHQREDNVQMIGIFGLRGIGKTTLAKVIYSLSYKKFEGSCFIPNIGEETCQGRTSLCDLQKQLLFKTVGRKFDIYNVDQGMDVIRQRLRSKRVFIVLDDINDKSQLELLAAKRDWLGCGSVIVITTANADLLTHLETHEKYEVDMLNNDEALQLFSWHAFGAPKPLEGYVELSKRIAKYTGGLPVALALIGSHLNARSISEWKSAIEKMSVIPYYDVHALLRRSYDQLDDDTQRVFLDIACFFIGENKKNVVMALNGCGFYAESAIRILIDRCLLRIESGRNEILQMHDVVRAMGREIVRIESPRYPGKRSRLVEPMDVYNVLIHNEGTEAIEGIIVDSDMFKNVTISTTIFKRMPNLRILILNDVRLKGSFKYLYNLRFFRWHNCHLTRIPSDFWFEKLVVLYLHARNIEGFQLKMKRFRCLKTFVIERVVVKAISEEPIKIRIS